MTDENQLANQPAGEAVTTPVVPAKPEPEMESTDLEPEQAEPEAPAPTAKADPEPEAEETPKPEPKRVQKVPDWMQKKMNELAAAERAAAREAKEAKARAAELAAQLEEARQAREGATEAPKAASGAPNGLDEAEFNKRVELTARQLSQQERFNAQCNQVSEVGRKEFPDFNDAVQTLNSASVLFAPGTTTPTALMEAALATDSPHQVLYELAKDPELAQSLLSLSPAQLGVKLAKMTIGSPAPTVRPISKAPPPASIPEGTAKYVGEPSDDDDDDTYFEKRKRQIAERKKALGIR